MKEAARGVSGETSPGLEVGGSSPILRSLAHKHNQGDKKKKQKPSPAAWEIRPPAVPAGELRGWVSSQVQPVLRAPAWNSQPWRPHERTSVGLSPPPWVNSSLSKGLPQSVPCLSLCNLGYRTRRGGAEHTPHLQVEAEGVFHSSSDKYLEDLSTPARHCSGHLGLR